MNTSLIFYDYETNELSPCGEVLNIEVSSKSLNWKGVILEKGSSPYFYPTNVATPYFYFAMSLGNKFSWQVNIDEGVRQLITNQGEIWINPPRTPFTHNISESCYFIILAIEEEEFISYLDINMKSKVEELLFLNNYNVKDNSLKNLIELFYLEALNEGKNGYSYIQNLMRTLVTYYINNFSNYIDLISSKGEYTALDSQSILKIDSYLDANIEVNISIEDIAKYMQMSKFYFLREFKRKVGITPYQYILNKRLERAKTLLEHTDYHISEISYRCGFSDQSHFSKIFKSRYDVSPNGFRKQIK